MSAFAMMMAVLGAPRRAALARLLPIPGGPLPTMVTDEKVVQKILAPRGTAAGPEVPYVTICGCRARPVRGAPVPPGPRWQTRQV